MASFNEQVYALVRLIPPGKVLTYGRVAAFLDVPMGARAVGWALHALPAESDVPWHRVINAQRQISTRLEGYAMQRQRAQLEAEGITFDDTDHVPADAMWTPTLWEIHEKIGSDTIQR